MRKVAFTTVAIVLVLVLLGFLFVSSNNKAKLANAERFYVDGPAAGDATVASAAPANPDMASAGIGAFAASDPMGNEVYNPVETAPAGAGGAASPAAGNCLPRDTLSAADLLPKDAANSRWSQMNPAGQGELANKQFLSAGYHIGIDSIGSSKKNASLDLRKEPMAPRMPVSPWMNSTIEYSHKYRTEIGVNGE